MSGGLEDLSELTGVVNMWTKMHLAAVGWGWGYPTFPCSTETTQGQNHDPKQREKLDFSQEKRKPRVDFSTTVEIISKLLGNTFNLEFYT